MALGRYYRDAADVVVVHNAQGVAHGLGLLDGHRIVDHTVLRALHLADFGSLGCYAHILVDDADSSLTCEGDGHRSLGYGVHCSGHDRDVESNVS